MKSLLVGLTLFVSSTSFAVSMAPCDITLEDKVKKEMANDLGVSFERFNQDFYVSLEEEIEQPVRLKIYTAIFTNDTTGRGKPLHYVFKFSKKQPQHIFGCEITGMIAP